MRTIIAFIVWALLVSPAINLGSVIQSHLVPGPVVEVHFEDKTVAKGHVQHHLDGSAWVKEEDGTLRKLHRWTEIRSTSIPALSEISEQPYLLRLLCSTGPLIVLTALLFAYVVSTSRLGRDCSKG